MTEHIPVRQGTLEQFVAPEAVEIFHYYWERNPLHTARQVPEWCARLPGAEDVHAVLAENAVIDGQILRIVRTQGGIPIEIPYKRLA